mmetsp:Transcript_113350/g.325903  ORF Transcript_113350/g.325903 Transcript_113350/m.325903 type:complete len:201 (+) Transcript_113350:786-1388(+)
MGGFAAERQPSIDPGAGDVRVLFSILALRALRPHRPVDCCHRAMGELARDFRQLGLRSRSFCLRTRALPRAGRFVERPRRYLGPYSSHVHGAFCTHVDIPGFLRHEGQSALAIKGANLVFLLFGSVRLVGDSYRFLRLWLAADRYLFGAESAGDLPPSGREDAEQHTFLFGIPPCPVGRPGAEHYAVSELDQIFCPSPAV